MFHRTTYLEIELRNKQHYSGIPPQRKIINSLAIRLKMSLSTNFSLGCLPCSENRSKTSTEMSLKILSGYFLISSCCNQSNRRYLRVFYLSLQLFLTNFALNSSVPVIKRMFKSSSSSMVSIGNSVVLVLVLVTPFFLLLVDLCSFSFRWQSGTGTGTGITISRSFSSGGTVNSVKCIWIRSDYLKLNNLNLEIELLL